MEKIRITEHETEQHLSPRRRSSRQSAAHGAMTPENVVQLTEGYFRRVSRLAREESRRAE